MKLIYVMDPMCSWCWAFKRPLEAFLAAHPEIPVRLIMGGLAPDSDTPMLPEMREKLQHIWRHIEQQTGTPFNHDFWTQNTPRRSTYPACRALLAAKEMCGSEGQSEMLNAIQSAYYQRALNPSDTEVLIGLAGEIGLDSQHFEQLLSSAQIEALLRADLTEASNLGVGGFPTLLLQTAEDLVPLALGYSSLDKLEQRFNTLP